MDRKNRRVTYLTGANATFNAYGMNDDQKKKKNKKKCHRFIRSNKL